MKWLITCLHLSGRYDQLNSPCLALMETIARRIAPIVEAYSGDGSRPRWAGVHHYEGRTDAMDCIDPNLTGRRREENSRGIGSGESSWKGHGDERWCKTKVALLRILEMVLLKTEPPPPGEAAAKGVLEAWRQRHNDCEPGQRKWDDRWPNQVPGKWIWYCAGLSFPFTVCSRVGPATGRSGSSFVHG